MDLKNLTWLDGINIIITGYLTYLFSTLIRLPIYFELYIWIGFFYFIFKFNSLMINLIASRYEVYNLNNEFRKMDPDNLIQSFSQLEEFEIGKLNLTKILADYDDEDLLRIYNEIDYKILQRYVIRHVKDEETLCKLVIELSETDDIEFEMKYDGISRIYDPEYLKSIIIHSTSKKIIRYALDRIYSKQILAELRITTKETYQELLTQRINSLRREGFID